MANQTNQSEAPQIVAQFVAGQTYSMAWNDDSDTRTNHLVIRRTAKSIWINKGGEVVRRAVKVYGGTEYVWHGNYAQSPWLRAADRVETETKSSVHQDGPYKGCLRRDAEYTITVN